MLYIIRPFVYNSVDNNIHSETNMYLLSHVAVFLVKANTTTTTTTPPPAANNTPQLTPTAMYTAYVVSSSIPSGTSISVADTQMYRD